MDISTICTDSLVFTRETLIGKPSRWLIMILLCLPWMVVSLLSKLLIGSDIQKIRWESIPYGPIIALIIAGMICELFLIGYNLRILRGGRTPPEFNNWVLLAVDAIKMMVLSIIWALPVVIIILTIAFILGDGGLSGGGLILFLLMLLIAVVYVAILIVILPISIIRFARNGSIGEGLTLYAIQETIDRIGWGKYIVALVILVAILTVYSFVSFSLQLIPIAGDILSYVFLVSVMNVFAYRYLSNLYDCGQDAAGAEPKSSSESAPAQV
jgi:hypothetical protein